MHVPELNGPDGRFLFHSVGKHFYIAFFGFALANPKNISHIQRKGGDFMKNDPGLQEEKKIPEPSKPSWFQVAGDIDDFIFYDETEKTCSQR